MKQTSLEAYADSRERARQHRAKILQAFRAVNKPLTISEVAEVSRLSYHQVGRRLSELTNEKRIRVSKEFGLSPTGRKAHKWELIKEEVNELKAPTAAYGAQSEEITIFMVETIK